MALRYFTTEEMVALTTTWADPAHSDHTLLTSRPVLAALIPELIAAHNEVLAVAPPEVTTERLDEIRSEQGSVDDLHDRYLRGMYFRLQSEKQLTDNTEVSEQIDALQQLILPDGLANTQKRYREQAGHAERVEAQITDDQQTLLTQWGVHDGTLADVFRNWLTQAARLGELDHERNGTLVQAEARRRIDNARARNRWMRVVRLLQQNAELLQDDGEIAELLGRIERADEQRQQRDLRAGQDEPADADDDASEAGEPGNAGDANNAGDAGNAGPNGSDRPADQPAGTADTRSVGAG